LHYGPGRRRRVGAAPLPAHGRHELRFASAYDGPFNWVGGVYYADENLDELYTSGFNGSFGPAFSVLWVPYKQEVETLGIFAQGDYAVNDKVKIVAGLRMLRTKREELPRRKHGNVPL
jgi:outer membrane receptor protein involved in Fe transport